MCSSDLFPSHDRVFARALNKKQKQFEAVGFIKPGGRAQQVLDKKNIDGEKLKKEDVLVIVCGANDVAANEAAVALTAITVTLEEATQTQTQVVLVDLPKRYDLLEWSCVNHEVNKTNKHLEEISAKFENVTLVEASKAGRSLHTSHGLHLNSSGKNWLADQILKAVSRQTKGSESPQLSLSVDDGQLVPPGTESPPENYKLLTVETIS